MSHIKLGNKKINVIDVIADNDRPAVLWLFVIGLLTILLTFPLMASPLVGITILEGYLFYVVQILFFGVVNTLIRLRALTLIARKTNTNGN